MSQNQNRAFTIAPWIPFTFCVLLTQACIWLPGGAGSPAFYCFLPMCFFFVASMQLAMARRLRALEEQLATARAANGG